MFYSHEILTDRKHGVATIWLVATLGSKSALKKITRKAIMDVNVPDACGTITDPSAPMALRLQGSLLFGVSRVFSQQCAYVLTDMQNLRDKMRGITMLLKDPEVDPDVANTRPEQLNLSVDPGFNIELDLGFDLTMFDNSFSSSKPSSMLSPRTLASSQTSFLEYEQGLDDVVPLSSISSQGVGGRMGFIGDGLDAGIFSQPPSRVLSVNASPPDACISDDNSVVVGHDRSLILRSLSGRPSMELYDGEELAAVQEEVGDDLGLDIGEDEPLLPRVPQPDDMDDENFIVGNDDYVNGHYPPEASVSAPTSTIDQQAVQTTEQTEGIDLDTDPNIASGAAQQRHKQTKVMAEDNIAEIPNRTLGEWSNNYNGNMDLAREEQNNMISISQAKWNAAYWVLDQGIAGFSSDFHEDLHYHPLAALSGQNLLDILRRSPDLGENRKRSASVLDEDGDVDQQHRRVRSRSAEEIPGENDTGNDQEQVMAEAEGGITVDEYDYEPEMGREPQEPMSDHPDTMPWNTYASSRGGSYQGSARPAMSIAGASSGPGGLRSFDVMPSSVGSKRFSRLIAESPLEQRRRLMRGQSLLSNTGGPESIGDNDFGFSIDDSKLDRQLAGGLDASNFELYGPAAAVSTQEAADPQWLAATLEQEAFNFLTFLQTSLEGVQAHADEDSEDVPVVTFQELLPPNNNTEIVAAQGLLHVLALATKGLVHVQQKAGFGAIEMSLVRQLRPAQPDWKLK